MGAAGGRDKNLLSTYCVPGPRRWAHGGHFTLAVALARLMTVTASILCSGTVRRGWSPAPTARQGWRQGSHPGPSQACRFLNVQAEGSGGQRGKQDGTFLLTESAGAAESCFPSRVIPEAWLCAALCVPRQAGLMSGPGGRLGVKCQRNREDERDGVVGGLLKGGPISPPARPPPPSVLLTHFPSEWKAQWAAAWLCLSSGRGRKLLPP